MLDDVAVCAAELHWWPGDPSLRLCGVADCQKTRLAATAGMLNATVDSGQNTRNGTQYRLYVHPS